MADDVNINIGSDPTGVEQGSKRAKVAIKGVSDEGKQLDAALRRVKSAIDPTFAAQDKLNRKLDEAKRLLDAGKISQSEYTAAVRVYRQELEREVQAIERNSAAAKASAAENKRRKQEEAQAARAAAQEKIAAAREERRVKERLEAQERNAIKLSAQLARQAAIEAQRAARTPSQRSVGRVDPAVGEASRSIRQLEYDITRAMAKAERLSQRATDQAARAAQASSAKVAQVHQQAAQRSAAAATETHQRVIELERSKASQIAAAKQQEINAERQARQAARESAQEAARAAAAKKKAAADAARAAREAAQETERQARAERQAANAAQELRASIDPAYASQMRYNETMRRATQLLMQNKLQMGEWTAIQRQAKAQMDLNVRSLGRQNAMYVQMGYQAQDVVASWGSGISPLVILAQQGGQTAAALSMMGGTAGKVAAFFAGPWGAAILGATMLIGFLFNRTKDAEKAALDLTDAQAVQRASLEDLRKAIKDFNEEQRRQNDNTWEQAEAQLQAAQNAVTRTEQIREQTVALLEQAVANAELLESTRQYSNDGAGGSTAFAVATAMAEARVQGLRDRLKEAREAAGEARDGLAEIEIQRSRAAARRATDERAAIENRYDREEALIIRTYRASEKTAADRRRMDEALLDIARRRAAEEESISRSARDTADAYAEGVRTFQSREQAIGQAGRELQQSGFRVTENDQFGGVRGNHPGMGNAAHGRYAADVNIGVGNIEAASPAMRSQVEAAVRAYQARGYRILWNGRVYEPLMDGPGARIPTAQNQHRDHFHIEAPASIVGRPMDRTSAEASGLTDLEQIRREALDSYLEDLTYQQQLAEEDYQEQLRLQDEKISALREFYGESSREAIRAQRERVVIERRMQQQLLQEQRTAIEQRRQLDELAANRNRDVANAGAGIDADNQRFNEQNRLVSPEDALAARAALLDREYAMEAAHESRIYQLRSRSIREQLELANIPAERRAELMRELELLEAEHLARREAAQAEYARDVNRIQLESAQLVADKWRDVAQTLTQSMNSALQGIWTRSITFQEAMINMADALVYKFFDMGTQMLEDWMMRQLGMTAAQQTQDAARTASTVGAEAAKTGAVMTNTALQTGAKTTAAATEQTVEAATVGAKVAGEAVKSGAAVAGAATSTAATAGMATSEITSNAAAAAAGAYKSTVVIPFIGPVAAPAAAALALAAVLGFGALVSSRGGLGEVGRDGQGAILHKKETVLPAWIAEPMRQMFVSPRSRAAAIAGPAASAGAALREASSAGFEEPPMRLPPIHFYAAKGMTRSEIEKQAGLIVKIVKNAVRNREFSLP